MRKYIIIYVLVVIGFTTNAQIYTQKGYGSSMAYTTPEQVDSMITASGGGGATDTTKIASLHGNSWGDGMYLGSKNDYSVRTRVNNVLRSRLDTLGAFTVYSSNSQLQMGYDNYWGGPIIAQRQSGQPLNFGAAGISTGNYVFNWYGDGGVGYMALKKVGSSEYSLIDVYGRINLGTTSEPWKTVTTSQYFVSAMNTAPSSSSDTGTLGEIRITATYIYVCTATNTWVRTALATW